MSTLTASERIAIEQVLGIVPAIKIEFQNFMEGYNKETVAAVIKLRDKIDAVLKIEKDAKQDAEFEAADLRYQLKELIYRIEERRDIRNDILYKDLKRLVNVA